jgi:hypothetical protein
MITIKQIGNFRNTERFLNNAQKLGLQNILKKYAIQGVAALALATPKDTGETAAGWDYKVEITQKGYKIFWLNNFEEYGVIPAILIQYGHGTKGGTYVQGIDYINAAMKPVLNQIAEAIWKEVSNL